MRVSHGYVNYSVEEEREREKNFARTEAFDVRRSKSERTNFPSVNKFPRVTRNAALSTSTEKREERSIGWKTGTTNREEELANARILLLLL